MENILSHYIVNLLLTQEKAFLPRVGVLTLENVSAEVLPNIGKINPPRKMIVFGHSDRIARQDLYDQFLNWRDLDSESALQLSHNFEDEFHRRLIEGSMKIKEIGTFTNTETGITFEQDEYSKFFNPLPTLNLKDKKVSKSEKATAASAAIAEISAKKSGAEAEEKPFVEKKTPPPPPRSEKKKKKAHWLLWLILIIALLAIIGIALISFLFYGGKSKSDITERPSTGTEITATNIPVADSETYIPTSPEIEDSDNMEVNDENQDAQSPEENTSITSVNNVIQDEDANSSDPQKNVNISDSKTPTEIVEEPIKTVEEQQETPIDQNMVESSSGMITGNCIVIVGAFSNESNANKMMKKIENLGYESYSDVRGRLTRVGLKSPCERQELNKNLRFAKNKIEAKSWIL